MSKAWAKGTDWKWQVIRRQILAKNKIDNGGKCQLAIPKVCTGEANSVHHILGRDVTGDDPSYLIACCLKCNLHVGRPKRRSPDPKPVTRW